MKGSELPLQRMMMPRCMLMQILNFKFLQHRCGSSHFAHFLSLSLSFFVSSSQAPLS